MTGQEWVALAMFALLIALVLVAIGHAPVADDEDEWRGFP